MNEPRTSTDCEKTSDEDDNKTLLGSKQQKPNALESDKIKNHISNNSSESRNFSKLGTNDSAYFIYHPPKYRLPPYLDPNQVGLDLRERIKVMCSYHTLICKSILQQAKLQVDSCSYPEPIDPIPSRNDNSVDNRDYIIEDFNQGSGDNSEEYISRSGRKTKRKFYAENKLQIQKVRKSENGANPSRTIRIKINKIKVMKKNSAGLALKILEGSFQDSNTSCTDTGQDDASARRKAALTPTRSRNPRQRQAKSENSGDEAESGNNANARTHSPSLGHKPQKRSNDGFIEPAAPAAAKRATRKTIKCPICGVDFPEKEVEQHASSCGELPAVADNMNPNAAFRCDSCKELMRTLDDYEIHCTTCNGGPSHRQ